MLPKQKIHENAINRLESEKSNYLTEIENLKKQILEDDKESNYKTQNLNDRLSETKGALKMVEMMLEKQKKFLVEVENICTEKSE